MKKFVLLSWAFAIICSLVLCFWGLNLIIDLKGMEEFGETFFFNKSQIEISLETVKALLPMCLGYIIFIAPAIKYLKVKNLIWNKQILICTCLTFIFAIIAVGLWSGVFAYLGNAAGALEDPDQNLGSFYNYSWNRAIRFSSLAHLSFFISVAWFISTVVITLLQEEESKEKK